MALIDLRARAWGRIEAVRGGKYRNHPGHDQKSHGRKGGGGRETVRDSLTKAKDTKAIGAAAEAEAKRITGRDISFDFDGSDPQIAREHAEGVLQGLERYPGAPLVRVQQGGDRYAEDEEAWASCSRDGRIITFSNDAQLYGADGYRGDLQQAAEFGELVGATPRAVALHEFGHSVANGYELNGWANNKGSEYAEIEMDTSDVRAAAGKAISRRAARNDRELAAEALADVMLHGENASGMSRHIVDTMDSVVRSQDAAGAE